MYIMEITLDQRAGLDIM